MNSDIERYRTNLRDELPTIAAAEFADRNKYSNQADALALSADERGNAAVVQAVAGSGGTAGVTRADIARAEPWHRGASGNNLRAAVLGADDGLVSNFCLVMGIAGTGRQSVERGGDVGWSDLSHRAVRVARRAQRDRRECGGERDGARRDRCVDVAVQRTRRDAMNSLGPLR